eukprot:TRINITY_DN4875_c0_g1_i1.p1 TRINITY_DN4875_c0_g1~~TRINITY_DN4875_c0_g1_i1.p1  ORF type:complete len:452 (+),score=54.30 TRINITY_DN4875_c0_g1_i1:308-1663(+)
MAVCSSSFRQLNDANISNDCSLGIDFTKIWSQNIRVEVRGIGCPRNRKIECKNLVKEPVLLVSSEYKRARGFAGSRKHRTEIRSELKPQIETQSTDPTATISQKGGDDSSTEVGRVSETSFRPDLDKGGSSGDSLGGGSGSGGGNSGGGGSGNGEENDYEEKEFGPILKFEEVIRESETRGVSLPSDMLEAAKTRGIREVLLLRYLDLQGSVWPLGLAIRSLFLLRNRMLADPSFLFKVATEVVIDSCCATFAEVQKRGKDFWAEFELYVADLLVGVVVDIALVGLLAPYVRFGQTSVSKGLFGRMQRVCGALPSSVFEAETPGCKFSIQQRVGTFFYKGVLYGSVGFACGIIGQGIANLIMTAKRSIRKSEEDIPVPPLVKSAALWGVFLAVSSNTRYQIVNGLERLVEASPLARKVPPVALAFTVGVRFSNNIYGGMQFVDWARWSGVQ